MPSKTARNFAATCRCGRPIQGERTDSFRTVECPDCGHGSVVFPVSPLVRLFEPEEEPPVVAQGSRRWRVAGLLAVIGIVVAVSLVLLTRPEDKPTPRPDSATEEQAAWEALRQGDHHTAATRFARALGGGGDERLGRLRDQCELIDDLLYESVPELLRRVPGTPDEVWQSEFRRRYAGRAVLFDAVMFRDAAGEYSLDFEVPDVRIEWGELELLERLPPQQQQRVRDAVLTLGEVDFAEQRRVMAEFLLAGDGIWRSEAASNLVPGGAPSSRGSEPVEIADEADEESSGVELAGVLSRMAAGPPSPAGRHEDRPSTQSSERFDFLDRADIEQLARLLEGEPPQTIAVVLSYQSTSRAAELLARLGGEIPLDVVRRLAEWDGAAEPVVADIEDALRTRWQQQAASPPSAVAAARYEAGTVSIAEPVTQQRLSPPVAVPPQPPANLEDLDPACVAAAVKQADREIAVLALTGTCPEMVGSVLALLPASEARQLRRALEHPGPLQLSDIEQARQELSRLATD